LATAVAVCAKAPARRKKQHKKYLNDPPRKRKVDYQPSSLSVSLS
jgi:hypothetical protein